MKFNNFVNIKITNTKIYIGNVTKEIWAQLQTLFSYENKSVMYQYKELQNRFGARAKSQQWYIDRVAELEQHLTYSVFKYDAHRHVCSTYTGYLSQVLELFPNNTLEDVRTYKERFLNLVPTDKCFPMRDYQQECVEKLMQAKHGAISIATSMGKSRIIGELIYRHGVRTVVVVPSKAIAYQLCDDINDWFKYDSSSPFVKKNVCAVFADRITKKNLHNYAIIVATAQSLNAIKPESENEAYFKTMDMIIADESHTLPAVTFEKVCQELLSNCSYRYFVSGTQTRTDGTEHILNGIIGPIVKEISATEGIRLGWLPKPKFHIYPVESKYIAQKKDSIDTLTRYGMLLDENVLKKAAEIINKSVDNNMGTLVLVEELEQIKKLTPLLKHDYLLAIGGNDIKTNKEFDKEVTVARVAVQQFNEGKKKLLIGTSTIGMGVNTIPVDSLVYLRGGSSFISVSQGVGRGFRKYAGKEVFYVHDFDVINIPRLHRHAELRKGIYREIYDSIHMHTL